MAFTYFFRDLHTLDLIIKHVVPTTAGRRYVRIWDAGCAMGPEPYSLAILLAENMGSFAFKNVHIDATDIDESGTFGQTIAAGIYPYEELQRIPEPIFRKYFTPAGVNGSFQIAAEIRNRVKFTRNDLLSLQPVGDQYTLVMCKNVLLHFQPQQRTQVIGMFHRVLAPGGFFATEQTQALPEETTRLFEQVTADGHLFRKAAS